MNAEKNKNRRRQPGASADAAALARENSELRVRLGKAESTLKALLTAARRTEQSLRESEAREHARRTELESLLELVPTPVWIAHDRECRKMTANRAARELLGAAEGEAVTMSAPDNGRPKVEARRNGVPLRPEEMTMQRAAATGRPVLGDEVELIYPNGSSRFVIANAVPLFDEDGAVRGCIGAPVDITERRQTEQALRDAQAKLQAHAADLQKTVDERTVELRAANRRLQEEIEERHRLEREVLASVEWEQRRLGRDLHDDLCQQLTAIEYFSQTLARDIAKRCKRTAKRAKQIASMVRLMTVQTRDLARGLSPLSLEAEGLMAALKELAARTERVFGLECRFLCKGPVLVPDQAMGVQVYRIAQEAVSNAVKHSRTKRIDIELGAEGSDLLLCVRDHGIGIPSTTNNGKNGMGLRLMRYRAGMVGGSLRVESIATGGTAVVCHVLDGLLPLPVRSRI